MSKYTIVKKDNNGIIVGDVSYSLDKDPYLHVGDSVFNDELAIRRRKEHINGDQVLSCVHTVDKLIHGMSINKINNYFNSFFELEDSNFVVNEILKMFGDDYKLRSLNTKLVASIFVKSIIKTHYDMEINKFSNEEFNAILNNRITSNNYEELFCTLLPDEADKVLSSDFSKLCVKAFVSSIDDRYDSKREHLCWNNCTNAEPTYCDKVYDIWNEKMAIDKYPFITDGYQIYKDGNLDKFIVRSCDNYKCKKKVK